MQYILKDPIILNKETANTVEFLLIGNDGFKTSLLIKETILQRLLQKDSFLASQFKDRVNTDNEKEVVKEIDKDKDDFFDPNSIITLINSQNPLLYSDVIELSMNYLKIITGDKKLIPITKYIAFMSLNDLKNLSKEIIKYVF